MKTLTAVPQKIGSLADVTRYAEFYRILPNIAGIITSELLTIDGYWQDVAKEPLFHLALRRKLRSPEIYMDALRHTVGSYNFTRHPDRFCAELSMDGSNFRVVVYKKREKLDAITTALGLVLNVWQLF